MDDDLSGNSSLGAEDDDDLPEDSFVLDHIIGLALPTAAARSAIHDIGLATASFCLLFT